MFRVAPRLYRGAELGGGHGVFYARVESSLWAETTPGGLIVDARDVRDVRSLRQSHRIISQWIRGPTRPGRRLIMLLDDDDMGLGAYARSVARELAQGTVNVVRGSHIPTLRFLLSGRAACVTRADLRSVGASKTCDAFDERLEACLAGESGWLPQEERGDDAHSSVRGLRVLVTGSDGGLGSAVATRLEEKGALVTRVDNVDFRDPDAAHAVAALCPDTIDCVAHVAGLTRDRTVKKMTERDFDDCLRVNYEVPLEIDTLLKPRSSLLFSSVVGRTGNFGQANYAAAKAALLQYAAKPGHVKKCIAPGYVDTPMTRKLPWLYRQLGPRLTALGQAATPMDVACAATFLCSPQSDALAGQALPVCAGSLLG